MAPIPAGLDFDGASTIPQSAILALEGLGGRAGVRMGDHVLINGASGCTGPFAVQMAKAAGATVTGVCRTDKMDFVRSLGADHVIDYTRDDYTRSGQRYDRSWTPPGTGPSSPSDGRSRRVARIGRSGGRRRPGSWRPYPRSPDLLFGGRTVGLMLAWKPNDPDEMAVLGEMLEAGILAPVIDRRYPLDQVPDAIRYLSAGKARGKLVITM